MTLISHMNILGIEYLNTETYFSQCFPFEVDIRMKLIESKNLDLENKLADVFYIINTHHVNSYSYNALNKHKQLLYLKNKK